MGNSTNWNNLGSIQLQLNESLVSIPLPLGERKFHNTFTTEQKKNNKGSYNNTQKTQKNKETNYYSIFFGNIIFIDYHL